MTEKVKKLLRSIGGIVRKDPRELLRKERDLINQPFFFEGSNGRAVLLIHGWSSTPYEVRRLGVFLNGCGYAVSGPLLRGHGTVPRDLEDVHWTDWIEDLSRELDRLEQRYQKVYLVGTSIGANLSILLSRGRPQIAALVLMATPYRIRLERWMVLFARLMKLFKNYNRKFYPPTFGSRETITRLISYQSYPIDSALETFSLIREARSALPEVKAPCFLLQSTSDHIVAHRSLERIFDSIGSPDKRKKYVSRAYHTFISDIRNEHVFDDILDFLESH